MTHDVRYLADSEGFTVVEALVSVSIMMAVTGAVFALMNPAQGVFQAQPEASDMQQRLRVGVDALYRDLLMAGSGTLDAAGSLSFASVAPLRRGARRADQPGSFFNDRISILYAPSTRPPAKVGADMDSAGADVRVDLQPGCPVGDPVCGFRAGTMAVLFDETGAYDTFRVTGVVGGPGVVQHAGQTLSKAYRAGASLAEVEMVTYWLRSDEAAGTFELMQYDGEGTDLPIADHVVALDFAYYGDPVPPVLVDPEGESGGPRSSYGPAPPAPDVDNPDDAWGAGENCLFARQPGGQGVSSRLEALGAAGAALVPLSRERLTDGPWCTDWTSPGRYDADLLRVRRIRITLRVETGVAALRGTGPLFARAGTSRGGERFLPDQEVTFDVAPRNLNLGR